MKKEVSPIAALAIIGVVIVIVFGTYTWLTRVQRPGLAPPPGSPPMMPPAGGGGGGPGSGSRLMKGGDASGKGKASPRPSSTPPGPRAIKSGNNTPPPSGNSATR
jgi:hypothetical protein